MVQGARRCCTLVPTPIFSGGSDQDGDVAAAGLGEQAGFRDRGGGVVDERHRLFGQAAGDEFVAQLVVGVEAAVGSGVPRSQNTSRSAPGWVGSPVMGSG